MKILSTVGLLLFACALLCSAAFAADLGVLPTDAEGKPLNLDFETGTLKDWKAEGDAFAEQPIKGDTVNARRGDMKSEHQGEFWIGGYERKQDPPKGTLTSVPFKVTHPWGSFLVNGGDHVETRVDLVRADDGKVIFQANGKQQENMRRVVVDLRAHKDKEIFIRVVDEHTGHWGHINFDDFRFHQEKPAEVTSAFVRNVPDEYPHAGLKPEEAVKEMRLPDGFTVQLCAAEPEIKQPIGMAIDDRGRLWVAEAYEYPVRAPEGKGRDRILIFEDENGDGKFDKRKVFVEGLNLVSGIEVGFGGVWVGAAPYFMFIPDADGDDVPDAKPQVLLDGWGYHDTHETLNAFIWGPDGWLWGCHGVFTHSRVGKPGTPDDQRIPLNAAIWRYHPTRHSFEIVAHGTSNPWGVDFNDFGQAFSTACVIPHLYHIIPGARYERQAGAHFNPHTYNDIKTIADHRHHIGGIGANPFEGNGKSDSAGGGHAHCGAMIYLGGNWPAMYRNQIFMNNIHGQRVNMDVLEERGSGYVGSHGPDFLLTGDKASQMLNLRYGPDGNVYILDWYDMNACHHNNVGGHDRSNGRIYKVVYAAAEKVSGKTSERVDVSKLSDDELVAQVLHENDWFVRHSRRVLQERAAAGKLSDEVAEKLSKIASEHPQATRRLRAMWALHACGLLTEELLTKQLSDSHEQVRGWAARLAIDGQKPSAKTLETLAAMAEKDPSPVVRLPLASVATKLPAENRWEILTGLIAHPEDANDHNLPLMVWYAAEPLADANPQRALALGMMAGQSMPQVRDFMIRRIGSGDPAKSLAILVGGLSKTDEVPLQLTFLRGIRAALVGQRQVAPPADWAAAYEKLKGTTNPQVHHEATALAITLGDEPAKAQFRELALQGDASSNARRAAVESLLSARDKDLAPVLLKLLAEAPLRDLALCGLAQYDAKETPATLLAAYPKLTADEKRLAIATLCARPAYGLELLRAMQQKQIASADLSADMVRQLQNLKNAEVDVLLKEVWGTARQTDQDKAKLIAEYKALLAKTPQHAADASLGRTVFAKTCQRCHVLFGEGGRVGPDLTGSNRANLDYLLTNVLDPSSVMAKEYQPTVIVTADGRVVTGIVRAETDKSLTVQSAEETLIIPKAEIEQRALSPQSMMPEDQLRQFSEHEVRSLVAYLTGKEQIPLLATSENASMLFNGKDLKGWRGDAKLWSVENGEIVGRSPGINYNAFLVSDLAVQDFQLTIEFKLVSNAGNSGIQFRSQPLPDGEMKGYQADIGDGWWGKLYEESGRAILSDKSGEAHVKKGEWNTYRIEAIGPRVRTWINGELCVDLDDPDGARRGVFGLQLHSGGATEVRFRNLKLEVIEEPKAKN